MCSPPTIELHLPLAALIRQALRGGRPAA